MDLGVNGQGGAIGHFWVISGQENDLGSSDFQPFLTGGNSGDEKSLSFSLCTQLAIDCIREDLFCCPFPSVLPLALPPYPLFLSQLTSSTPAARWHHPEPAFLQLLIQLGGQLAIQGRLKRAQWHVTDPRAAPTTTTAAAAAAAASIPVATVTLIDRTAVTAASHAAAAAAAPAGRIALPASLTSAALSAATAALVAVYPATVIAARAARGLLHSSCCLPSAGICQGLLQLFLLLCELG
eukprot:1158221-Pelagomonas_calceolata.AAC.3